MDHIVSHCGKTLEKTNNDISTETALKNAMEQEDTYVYIYIQEDTYIYI